MRTIQNENAILSIGGLAKSSGIPVETLRNWERRYGFPSPARLESGHRRYALDEVRRLRLIRGVIELGYKPSFAVRADPTQLETLIIEATGKGLDDTGTYSSESNESDMNQLFGFVDVMDAGGMEIALRKAWSRYGASRFITALIVPFLREVGERWFRGQHSVAHEHFASETLQSFLAGQWRPLSQRARGVKVVLANLEGELHSLGLHMAAVFLTLNDVEVIFLGPNTPLEDIVTAASDPRVRAVAIGFSAASDIREAEAELNWLRAELETETLVIIGGNDNLPEIADTLMIENFEAFEQFASNLRRT